MTTTTNTSNTDEAIKAAKALSAMVSKVTTNATKLAAMIKSVATTSAKLRDLKAIASASAALYAIEHGNVTPLRQLYHALGDTDRADAFVKWAVNYAPVSWDDIPKDNADVSLLGKRTFFMDSDRREGFMNRISTDEGRAAFIEEMIMNPYWVFSPPATPSAYNFYAAINAAIKRAETAMSKGRDGNYEGLEEIKATILKFKPADKKQAA